MKTKEFLLQYLEGAELPCTPLQLDSAIKSKRQLYTCYKDELKLLASTGCYALPNQLCVDGTLSVFVGPSLNTITDPENLLTYEEFDFDEPPYPTTIEGVLIDFASGIFKPTAPIDNNKIMCQYYYVEMSDVVDYLLSAASIKERVVEEDRNNIRLKVESYSELLTNRARNQLDAATSSDGIHVTTMTRTFKGRKYGVNKSTGEVLD